MAIPNVALGTKIASAAFGNPVIDAINEGLEVGTYTPTLSGMVIGSGGTPLNTASYTFIGGILTVQGRIQFGTSGQTFPTNPSVTLPSGLRWLDVASSIPIGIVRFADSGTGFRYGVCLSSTSTTVNFRAQSSDATYVTDVAISTTIPMTWASNDGFFYQYSGRAEEF